MRESIFFIDYTDFLLISRKMWFKSCGNLCNLVCFFDYVLWRELLVSLHQDSASRWHWHYSCNSNATQQVHISSTSLETQNYDNFETQTKCLDWPLNHRRFCKHQKVYQFCYHRRPQEFHDIIVLQNSYKWCPIFKINLEKVQHVFWRHIYILVFNGSWKKFRFVCSIFGEVGYLRWKYSGISHLICGRIFGGLGSQLLAFSRSSLCVCRANTHLVSQSTPCKHL